MRGTPNAPAWTGARGGIIPAHAGNTVNCRPPEPMDRDHPRACGEHVVERRSRRGFKGSSPRMRGTPTMTANITHPYGIIPAHAGNTSSTWLRAQTRRDHPRACGEHDYRRNIPVAERGSSPRMRGTLFEGFDSFRQTGIIPAHAGNTKANTSPIRVCRDHPRACGEHSR